jgi:hypothetical protein
VIRFFLVNDIVASCFLFCFSILSTRSLSASPFSRLYLARMSAGAIADPQRTKTLELYELKKAYHWLLSLSLSSCLPLRLVLVHDCRNKIQSCTSVYRFNFVRKVNKRVTEQTKTISMDSKTNRGAKTLKSIKCRRWIMPAAQVPNT